jgi:hypothetical protein
MTRCFFADWDVGPCDGQPIRAHLIAQQTLKREFPHGAVLDYPTWRPIGRTEDRYDLQHWPLKVMLDDPRSWVPCCGGPTGIGGHHGQLDGLQLRIPLERLPEGFVAFCEELGLGWYVTRQYGEAARAA